MIKFFASVLVLFPLLAFGQSTGSFPAEIIAQDHGKTETFIVAADQMARKDNLGHFVVKSENAISSSVSKSGAAEARFILYPKGKEHNVANSRMMTERVILEVKPGADVALLAMNHGNLAWKPTPILKNHYVFTAPSAKEAMNLVTALRKEKGVISADFLLARQQTRRGVPNDPFFSKQWHLRNLGQTGGTPGIDANVVPIWGNFRKSGIRGRGVYIGIVDDGVQNTHPDIAPNYAYRIDYDWNDNTHYDASPSQSNGDFHGTCVAGVAAARGNNGIGVTGVAPYAKVTGLRLIAGYEDDNDEAEAFTFRSDIISVKNNSWGPADDGQTMEGPGPLAEAAFATATSTGRYGRGTIFTWAAGNGRDVGDNSDYDGYANSIYTMAVTAIDFHGGVTYYAEGGSNVLVGAPSDNYSDSGIVTTDLGGSNGYNYRGAADLNDRTYTSTFGGTSAAAPVATGVVALMLQQNPNLGWRDVQEIIIRSARKNDPNNSSWVTNAAGFHFNDNYGAGLINATAAVQLSIGWVNLTPMVEETQTDDNVVSIPDGFGTVEKDFTFPADQRVEHATVKVHVTHPTRGNLRIVLISPSGTVSELAAAHNDPNSDLDWTYMTVRNWGENSGGIWRLEVQDTVAGGAGTLDSAAVTLYGSAAPVATQTFGSVTAVGPGNIVIPTTYSAY